NRAAGISDITVVLGRHAEAVKMGWKIKGERIVLNPEPEKGQISSLRAGLKRLPPDADAMFLCLADQPLVSPSTCERLLECWRVNPGNIIIPGYKGKRGHPIILPKQVWELCFSGPDDLGLHWVTHHSSVKVTDMDVNDPGTVRDVDTPEDYERVRDEVRRGGGFKK
ncbi:MAG: nucleotidyltransferase family protein, partial [bacterium]